MPVLWLCVAGVAVAIGLGVGAWCLVRYARTRRRPFLVAGLVLTVGLGLIFLVLLAGAVLSTTIVYAPPPVGTSIIYAPPPTLKP